MARSEFTRAIMLGYFHGLVYGIAEELSCFLHMIISNAYIIKDSLNLLKKIFCRYQTPISSHLN